MSAYSPEIDPNDLGGAVLGGVDLRADYPDGYSFEVLSPSDGETFLPTGEQLSERIDTYLSDGHATVYDRDDNRELELLVRVTGSSQHTLALGENALERIVRDSRDAWTAFVWRNPDSSTEVAFDVTSMRLVNETSDVQLKDHERYWCLHLTCLPHVRALQQAESTWAPPTTATPTETVLDNGSSQANWAADAFPLGGGELLANSTFTSANNWTGRNATLSIVSGAMKVAGINKDWAEANSALFAVEPGRDYSASAVLSQLSGAQNARLQIYWKLFNGSLVYGEVSNYLTNPIGAVAINATRAPATATHALARITYYHHGGSESLRVHDATVFPTHQGVLDPLALSGGVKASASWSGGGPDNLWLRLSRSGLNATISDPYLMVDVTRSATVGSSTGQGTLKVAANGTTLKLASRDGSVSWYDLAPLGGQTLTGVTLTLSRSGSKKAKLISHKIATVDMIATTGGKMQTRTLDIVGTQRTPATVTLVADAGMGDTIVYTRTSTDGLAPNLRRDDYSSPSESIDGSALSRLSSDLSVEHAFNRSAAQVRPASYALYARLKRASGSGTHQIAITSEAVVGGTVVASYAETVKVDLTTSWTIVPLSALVLPEANLGEAGVIRIKLQADSSLCLLDDAFAFDLDHGQLTIVQSPTTSAGQHVWIEPASVSNGPTPQVWVGASADRSDAYSMPAVAQGLHRFEPPDVTVWVATTNSPAGGTLAYYPAYLNSRPEAS